MANKPIHQQQANHNEQLAKSLISSDYYDWSCTSAFYSALHFVESMFFDNPNIKHTDDCYNLQKYKGNLDGQSVHAFREILVGKTCPRARTAYRRLWEASDQLRYLRGGSKTACDLISRDNVRKMVEEDLAIVKKETNN